MSTRCIFAAASKVLAILLLALVLGACRHFAPDPVTLSYFRLGWSQPDESPTAEPLSQQFMRETGIRLKNLPVPETTLDQLDLSRKLLESGSGLDVLGVDLIWSGALAGDLLDLRPSLTTEISSLAPQLLPSYIVDGKVVAIPYAVQTGVLEYRADLLRKYGYDHPPRTWNELESMAESIQTGERAKGRKDFWGYIWQGADAEALTCNALEWQSSEGGGRIIEDNRTISVNNPAAIRSWQRARHWIGWISPPSVLAYRERDSVDVFDSGAAAFVRVWGPAMIMRGGHSQLSRERGTLAQGKTGYTTMPSGSGGSAGTLGGSGLAVSRHSLHPQEAIELVRFMIRAQLRMDEESERASADRPVHDDRPTIPDPQNRSEHFSPYASGVVNRPSSVVGAKYEQVARAYITAVHSVLTGERGAPEAAAELEKQLIKITGFRAGPPRTVD